MNQRLEGEPTSGGVRVLRDRFWNVWGECPRNKSARYEREEVDDAQHRNPGSSEGEDGEGEGPDERRERDKDKLRTALSLSNSSPHPRDRNRRPVRRRPHRHPSSE